MINNSHTVTISDDNGDDMIVLGYFSTNYPYPEGEWEIEEVNGLSVEDRPLSDSEQDSAIEALDSSYLAEYERAQCGKYRDI